MEEPKFMAYLEDADENTFPLILSENEYSGLMTLLDTLRGCRFQAASIITHNRRDGEATTFYMETQSETGGVH